MVGRSPAASVIRSPIHVVQLPFIIPRFLAGPSEHTLCVLLVTSEVDADGIMSGMDERLEAAERGENPTVLARLKTGWTVIGDTQHLPGYCLLLYRGEANHL